MCRRYGALLIFDEVVTVFRTSDREASGLFGIDTDLTVLGKVIAGGYLGAGGLGGKKEYLEYLVVGIQDGDKVYKASIGGTMVVTLVGCVAGYHTIKRITETGTREYAGKMGNRLTDGLKVLVQKYDLPFVAWDEDSVCHLEAVGTMHFSVSQSKSWTIPGILKEASIRKEEMEYMGVAYAAEGLITLAGSRLYISAAYTPELIDEALTRFERVLQKVVKK